MFIEAQRNFEISSAVLYLDPDKSLMAQARSQKSVMGGLFWGSGDEAPNVRKFSNFAKTT